MSFIFDKKCTGCPAYRHCRDSFDSWIYFIIGLIATVAIRAVLIFQNINPFYGKIAWYIGVTGFFIFFLYKFRIGRKRAIEIAHLRLAEKINGRQQLEPEDYAHLGAIICSLTSTKERINYFFIFASSIGALIAAIIWDILGT